MNTCILILAGGLGKRMKSDIPKVLHQLNKYSILGTLVNKIQENFTNDIFIVVGKYQEIIQNKLKEELKSNQNKINYVFQKESLGTGDALICSIEQISKYDKVIILNGDGPLISTESIKIMIESNKNLLGICNLETLSPTGSGRIIFKNNYVDRIIEEKDCSENEKKIKIVNGGLYCFNIKELNKYIYLLNNNNKQQEYYITDLISIFNNNNINIYPIYLKEKEIININTPEQLAIAKSIIF